MRARAILIAAVAACSHPVTPHPTAPGRFDLQVDARDPHALHVEGRYVNGGSTTLVFPSETLPAIVRFEVERQGVWHALDPKHPLEAQDCATDCRVRYTLDLDRAERRHDGVVAMGGGTYVAPPVTWLAQPSPLPEGTFELTVDGAAEASASAFSPVLFATGLRRRAEPNRFYLPSHDVAEGSFAAFGRLRHRMTQAPEANIEVVVVGSDKSAMTDDELVSWVQDDAGCVASFYRKFPVPRASIFLVPVDGFNEVGFGKVLSLGGASIIVFVGSGFPYSSRHDDWVLVHEMVHLGFPTMYDVRWLTEGLATFYEPLIRVRAGWASREWLWKALYSSMQRGVPDPGRELALDKRDSIDDIYWGGALFLLTAEVALRQATQNKKGFEDVMRAVLSQGGDATVVWTMPELVEAARKETGTNVFAELLERYATKGERVDLPKLFRDLGIIVGDKITFDEAAPLAAIRRSLETGK